MGCSDRSRQVTRAVMCRLRCCSYPRASAPRAPCRSGAACAARAASGLRELVSVATGERRQLQKVALTEADAKRRALLLATTDSKSRPDTHSIDAAEAAAQEADAVAVGPFVFSSAVFEWAQTELLAAVSDGPAGPPVDLAVGETVILLHPLSL